MFINRYEFSPKKKNKELIRSLKRAKNARLKVEIFKPILDVLLIEKNMYKSLCRTCFFKKQFKPARLLFATEKI